MTGKRSILQGESIELFRAANKNSASIERQIIHFISKQNSRAERGEITTATVGNCLKAVRLLLEMNDVSLNWKKIRRVLPRARRYALDRIPIGQIPVFKGIRMI